MEIIGQLGVILLLAFLTESLTEAVFGEPFDHSPKLQPYKWLLKYVAFAVGVAGAFFYSFDFLYLVGRYLGVYIPVHPLGIVLTGLTVGRGAQAVHDVIDRFSKPTLPAGGQG